MPKAPRLTPEQWEDVAEFYKAGHTLKECSAMWGFSLNYISVKLRKMGVEMRKPLVPRPEKERIAGGGRKRSSQTPVQSTRVGTNSEGRLSGPPPARKIIKLDGSDDRALYEKKVI